MPTWTRRALRRFRALFRGAELDAELSDEIRLHVELETEDLMRTRGLSREEAHRRAMAAFGGVQRYREVHRDARGVRWVEQVVQDAKYAVRSLRKTPGFAITAIVTIALGIGVTTTVYSVVNRLILRPLPFANGSRAVLFDMTLGGRDGNGWVLASDVMEWQQSSKSFEAIGILSSAGGPLTKVHNVIGQSGAFVTPALLSALGVRPVAGRLFIPADTVAGASRVVLLGESTWRRAFGGSQSALGAQLKIADTTFTVVGVVPDQLVAMRDYMATDFWLPMTAAERAELNNSQRIYSVEAAGVLKPGVPAARVAEELTLLARAANPQSASSSRVPPASVRLVQPTAFLNASLETGIVVSFAATLLVLLIACANVANIQLVRATRRAGEIAIRAALGASRWRLVTQLVVESMLLGVVGGTLGVFLGWGGVHAVVRWRPETVTELAVVQMDPRVVVFALLLIVGTSLVYGVLPALRVTRGASSEALRSVSKLGRTRQRSRVQSAVVIAEIAVTFVLLVGAGLPTRSFLKMLALDPGFQPDGLMELEIAAPPTVQNDSAVGAAFWQRIVARARSVPGVVDAMPAGISMMQFVTMSTGGKVQVDEGANAHEPVYVTYAPHRVPESYFPLMGIRLLAGQPFSAADERGETDARIVDSSFAAKLWPGESAVGKRYRPYWTGKPLPWRTVKGVVNDVGLVGLRRGLVAMQEYTPGLAGTAGNPRGILVRVRPGTNESAALAAVKAAVSGVDTTARVSFASTENAILSTQLGVPRFVTSLLVVFGALGIILAAIGLYGVIAQAVAERRHEIGVRIAMGAQSRDVIRMVLTGGLRLSVVGIAIGLAIALAATRVVAALLFNVSPTDPVVFVLIPAGLLIVAGLASYLPARRAARVDPVIALKAE
jgi:putative ABC transport system permease protein